MSLTSNTIQMIMSYFDKQLIEKINSDQSIEYFPGQSDGYFNALNNKYPPDGGNINFAAINSISLQSSITDAQKDIGVFISRIKSDYTNWEIGGGKLIWLCDLCDFVYKFNAEKLFHFFSLSYDLPYHQYFFDETFNWVLAFTSYERFEFGLAPEMKNKTH